jgi:hypothetical protein
MSLPAAAIVGKYIMEEGENYLELLQAFTHGRLTASEEAGLRFGRCYLRLELLPDGETWKKTEDVVWPGYSKSWSIRFRSGRPFSWGMDGSLVRSLVTKEGDTFVSRHEPQDREAYRVLTGTLAFGAGGQLQHTSRVEDGDGVVMVEATSRYRLLPGGH